MTLSVLRKRDAIGKLITASQERIAEFKESLAERDEAVVELRWAVDVGRVMRDVRVVTVTPVVVSVFSI